MKGKKQGIERESREINQTDIAIEVCKIRKRLSKPTFTPCTVRTLIKPSNTSVETMVDTGSSITLIGATFLEKICAIRHSLVKKLKNILMKENLFRMK